ncbi:hypothetical protein HV079_15810 [Citrobacter freundii]|uniref:hypothetical protein n=1 Tax=Citrobacter freundii TaxID=546 RepID=UPI0015E8FF14|nr:hypothetical protein [Citrobacter freundii]QLZ60524.1 hypothetical protein HV079_15810 [Citrobacter freundii]
MAWQGLPYPLRGDEIFNHTELFFNKIPKLIVELPEKGVSTESLVTVGITSIVALVAMITNTVVLLRQQKQQGKIADKTIRAQVVTANRQDWINELRDLVAEYVSGAKYLAWIQFKYSIDFRNYKKHPVLVGGKADTVIASNQRDYKKAMDDSLEKRDQKQDKISYLMNRIILMLNAEEEECKELTNKIETLASDLVDKYFENDREYLEFRSKINARCDDIIVSFQKYLKSEWEVIKSSI